MRITMFLLTLPLLAQQGVNHYSIEKEVAMGRQVASEIRKHARVVDDPGINAYVQRIGQELLAQIKEVPFPFHFEVHADGKGKEPTAVPGGFVFVPLVSLRDAENESEFAGLLAHAIGHAALRHSTRVATRGQKDNLASIPLIFMGGWSGFHADGDSNSLLIPLGYLKFHQTFELQADEFGTDLTARAGFDASAFKRYVERKQGADSDRSPLPPREVRLNAIQAKIETLPQLQPESGDEFRRAQATAKNLSVLPAPKEPPTLRRR